MITSARPSRLRSSPGQRSWSRWVLLLAGWTAFGLAQGLLRNALTLQRIDRVVLQLALLYLPSAWLWAAFTPAIGWWGRRVEFRFTSLLARVAAHVPLFLVTAVTTALVRRWMTLLLGAPGTTPFYLIFLFSIDLSVITYVVAVWAAKALDAVDLSVEGERRHLALQEQLSRAQLEYLELQLRPHFLFNALGAVTTLAHEAPQNAARMLRSLARLLEIAVSRQGKGLVSLVDELRALEHYLAIQRVRFSDWLAIERTVEPGAERALLPQFILQPLVENAVHHGLLQRSASGRIVIRAGVLGDRLIVSVCDNGVGLQRDSYRESRGVGLENIRARLRAVYGDDATLTLDDESGGGTVARLDIPLRLAPEALVAGAGAPVTPSRVEWRSPSPRAIDLQAPTLGASPAAIIGMGLALAVMRVQRSMAWVAMGIVGNDPMPSPPILDDLLVVALWLPLAPVTWLVARRYPLQRGGAGVAWRVLLHVAVAFIVVLAHLYLIRLPSMLFHAPLFTYGRAEIWSWDVSVYGILLAAAHQRQLAAWLRGRKLADERLKQELQEQRFDNVMLELRPAVLFDALRQVEDSLTRDARQAERTLAEIAAFLRHTLDSMRQRTMSLRAESEAVSAYARVLVAASAPGLQLRIDLPESLANEPVPNGLLRAVLDSALGGGERLAILGQTAVQVRVTQNGGAPSIAVETEGGSRDGAFTPSRQLLEYASRGLIQVTSTGRRFDIHIRERARAA